MKTRFSYFALLSASLLASGALANPWVRGEGEGFAAVNAVYYSTDDYYDAGGNEMSQPTFRKYELNPYVEYGLAEDWAVGASVFLHALTQESSIGDQENWGLGQTELFARYQLRDQDRFALSLEPFLALPASYEEDGEPRAGRDDSDLGIALNAGYGFPLYGQEHFAQLRTAYRHRYGPLEDQWQIEAKLGMRLNESWTVLPEVQWILPTDGTEASRVSVAGQNDYRLTKLQLSAVYDLNDETSLQGGIFGHVDGKNTGAGGGALLSLWRRF